MFFFFYVTAVHVGKNVLGLRVTIRSGGIIPPAHSKGKQFVYLQNVC